MAETISPADIDSVKWTRSDPFDNAFTTSPSRVTSALDIPNSQSRLTFPKLSIPLRSPSISTSTDSEVVHSDPGETLSPSLISCIFARQTSIGGSSSSHSHDTLLTPSLPSSSCGRPILRRPESSLNSATSDDGLSKTLHITQGLSKMQSIHGGFNGLGLSIDAPVSQIEKRQSCLTFAVRSPPSRPITNMPVSPRHTLGLDVNLDEDAEYDEVEEEDSEDDGYQEDEEGGFTSDEDLTSAFSRHPTSSGSSFISSRPYTPHAAYSPPFTSEYVPMSTSTSDDGSSRPTRGRKISIATTKCAEKCSRHRSPPPTHRSPLASPTSECPPAARSPSALGLCRRRETAAPQPTPVDGWRSDTPFSRTRSQGPPAPCKSILVKGETTSPGARRASMSAVQVLESAV